jgi:dipeptidyl aminopeptidase/acylaminoacyl peptidase
VAVLAACSAFAGPAWAQAAGSPAAIPAEDFARRPKMASLQYSPDGKRFAVREVFNGRMNLVTGKVGGGPLTRITAFEKEGDLHGFAWISNDKLVFNISDYQRGYGESANGGGLWVIDADGKGGRKLAEPVEDCIDNWRFVCRYTEYIGPADDDGKEIIVESNDRNLRSPDIYRLDVETNRRTLITTDNPGRVAQWVLDKDLRPRAALSWEGKTQTSTFWYRDDAAAPWRRILVYSAFETGMRPVGFGPDGTLYVASDRKTDTAAIYKFDPKTGQEGERIAHHPKVDITMREPPQGALGGLRSPLLFDPKTKELIGIAVDGDKPETHWLRQEEATIQATVDKAVPGAYNRIRSLGDGRWAITSSSDRDPGTYYIYDRAKGQLIELGRPRSWIDPKRMARVEVVRYKARDGLEIPGYLTLPAERDAKSLPLVAWIHGGPWARDDWGWDPEVQFLASRGYAVFQPNYRGSQGFGHKHLTSSFKKLGQSMQDDVTDGILHLVDKGIVDRNRVCIGGGSYGGYATMMGLVREPGLFKCGINVVGVTDLFWWLDLGYTDFNRWDADASGAWLTQTIGDPSKDADMMRSNSPRLQADKIKAPVLFVHGGGDMRVPIKHAEGMRDAMKERNLPYEWVVYPEEGHGFGKDANRLDYFRRMEAFLAKHLGPGR